MSKLLTMGDTLGILYEKEKDGKVFYELVTDEIDFIFATK